MEERRSSMSYQDKTLTCQDCGQSFVFSGEDQEYHAQKGFTNEPKRCPSCREIRRSQRNEGGYSSGGGGYRSTRREMFPAVCARCGKETQVPFQPRGDRPVYCSDCYNKQGGGSSSRY
jgi:CxxC-x17-CxxC domain-containing protein